MTHKVTAHHLIALPGRDIDVYVSNHTVALDFPEAVHVDDIRERLLQETVGEPLFYSCEGNVVPIRG